MIFLQESYDKNNDWAISKVIYYLEKNGYHVIPKVEDYSIDIEAVKNGKKEYFECEVKTGYQFTSKEDFRFSTVSFLGRKRKWADIGFWYIIICRETQAFVKCHSDVIFQDKYRQTIELKNSWSRGGHDTFYRVPKDLCEWGRI